ncbi:ATP-binding protein [Trinickia dinghuensis]|uniref:histidine kinase n=1 Tax=Trinickia dinghuensis TaxID=2291023 RepID=A0A3D8JX89_9BURK|nr:ATP-binding protein [Trinickia dinghuensis]RDU97255.1 HAMP domain-containing protein [Trinickia dinghuensis]
MSRALVPRSLLARNIALLVALVLLTQVCSLTVLIYYVQRPRVQRAAVVFAQYVLTLDRALATLPPGEGRAVVARLDAKTQPPADAVAAMQPSFVHFFRTYQRDVFAQTLRQNVPAETLVLWQPAHRQRLWIRIHVAGSPYWISPAISTDVRDDPIIAAIALSMGLAVIAALTGYLIQLHINRPLRHLAQAARAVSAGAAPPALSLSGPTEVADVSRAFNEMTEALRHAEATRSLMLAGVSHDIRTPLTKLRLALALAIPPDKDRALAASAESYLERIDAIVQQFMDYAGSGEREPAQIGDLNGLLSQIAADFAGLGHEFELALGEVPPFRYRPTSVMRLLMNLMQNAVAYGRSGLAVRTWSADGRAYVAICDRGDGITADELERLKAPFARGTNASRQAAGTGLGLAIVERIARSHGGSISFQAREGGGLEACVALPLQSPIA